MDDLYDEVAVRWTFQKTGGFVTPGTLASNEASCNTQVISGFTGCRCLLLKQSIRSEATWFPAAADHSSHGFYEGLSFI
jgi:hypothetical protein